MILVTDAKIELIEDRHNSYRDHRNAIFWWERDREIGINPKYSIGSRNFVARDQGWGSMDDKLLRENIKGKGVMVKSI